MLRIVAEQEHVFRYARTEFFTGQIENPLEVPGFVGEFLIAGYH